MIIVYYLNPNLDGNTAQFEGFSPSRLNAALKFCEDVRRQGMMHVVMSSEMPGSVGSPGVDCVVDGKTPDGVDYTWKKRRN